MPATIISNTEFVPENVLPMNNVIKQSYDHTMKHIQGGVTAIHDGFNVIKDELIGMYDKAATYVNKMTLPVNNFLKDLTQIEAELQAETVGKQAHMGGCIIPIEEALKGHMEENY